MKQISGAMPLSALDAVAVDCETTGLDVARDRIVQLAGIGISKGEVREQDAFDTYVDPRIPISSASTGIHGVTNAMVRFAPSFSEALPRFLDFGAGRILIGHSIGFDLAVMEHEARRAGIAWRKPRSLCVRLLGAIANPRLPEESLDALAGWLGVAIGRRHSATGDALAAAEVFVALLPHLAERGIGTLAEAERACLALTTQLENAHRAGWVEPVTRPDVSMVTSPIDPYVYRHRVRELMSSPAATIAEGERLDRAIALMSELRISALFVSADGRPGGPIGDYGIVTERDVLRAIASMGGEALHQPVSAFTSRPLASIAGGAFVYRAVGRMQRLRIRHLAVRDEAERLAGIVSARDLLRLRAGAAISLDDAIGAAASPVEMAQAWATLPSVARSLLAEELDARTITGVVSEEIRVMTRRAAELAEEAMRSDGLGAPPCPYALLVLGSGGRGESLLAPDQDNAIVFATGEPGGPEDAYFAELGARISQSLDTGGIPFCKGGVMASNPGWRGSLVHWKRRIDDWVGRSRAEDLLNVDIFYDMRPVHGDLALGAELFDHAYAAAGRQPVFAKLMGEKLFDAPSPFTFLGGIATENGRIDLKRFGLFPIVTAARALAIRHGVPRRSTRGRLQGLAACGIGGGDVRRLGEAHALFMSLLLGQQSHDLEVGVKVSNAVEVSGLSRAAQADLKTALKQAQQVPDMVRGLMFD